MWIVEDWTAWMQSSGGGKEWLAQPPAPPSGGGGSSDGDGGYRADWMSEAEADDVAQHALFNPDGTPRGHIIPGANMQDAEDKESLSEHVRALVNDMELAKEWGYGSLKGYGPKWRSHDKARGYWDVDNQNLVIRHQPNDSSESTVFHREDGGQYFFDNFRLDNPPS